MMPLKKGSSKKTVSDNIRMEMHTGTPRRQAIAIAMDMARRSMKGMMKSMPMAKKGK